MGFPTRSTVWFFGGAIAGSLVVVELARWLGWRFPLGARPADWATAAAALVFLVVGLAVDRRGRVRSFASQAQAGDGQAPRAIAPVGPGMVEALTPRELELLASLAAGLSNAEIAAKHFVTANTVKTHLRQIYGKLEVTRRVQAVRRARDLGLIS